MRLLCLSAFLLAVGCRHYQAEMVQQPLSTDPTIKWESDIVWDEARTTVAGGKVWLLIDGQAFLISEDAVGECTSIDRSSYVSEEVPVQALSASKAWWAGVGQTFYVVRQRDEFLVYWKEYSEAGPRDPPYSLVKVIRYAKKS